MRAFLQRRGHNLLAQHSTLHDTNVLGAQLRTHLQPDVGRTRAASHAAEQHLPSADFNQATPLPAKRYSTAPSASSGYSIAPNRPEHPATAVPDIIQPIDPSQQKPQSSTSAPRRTPQPQRAADATAEKHSWESCNLQDLPRAHKKQQQQQQQPKGRSSQARLQETSPSAIIAAANESSSKLHRRRGDDPARAFMRAGIPSGLWVLPLDASVDAPPAPPPVAPENPEALLRVLQNMAPPRRRLVIFKAGGYIYSDMEALITQHGLGHVLRLTNLIRKAHCVLAKPVWDNGRHVNLKQHQAAATKARVPFLTINKLDAVQLVEAVRPVLIKKRIVIEHAGALIAD